MKKIVLLVLLLMGTSITKCFCQQESTKPVDIEWIDTFANPTLDDVIHLTNNSPYTTVVYMVYWETVDTKGKRLYIDDDGNEGVVFSGESLDVPYGEHDGYMLKVEGYDEEGRIVFETYPISFNGGTWYWVFKDDGMVLTQDVSELTVSNSKKEKKTPPA